MRTFQEIPSLNLSVPKSKVVPQSFCTFPIHKTFAHDQKFAITDAEAVSTLRIMLMTKTDD